MLRKGIRRHATLRMTAFSKPVIVPPEAFRLLGQLTVVSTPWCQSTGHIPSASKRSQNERRAKRRKLQILAWPVPTPARGNDAELLAFDDCGSRAQFD